jgi:hypothetical protein
MDAGERARGDEDTPEEEPAVEDQPSATGTGDDSDDADGTVVEEVFDLFNAREAVDPTTSSTGVADEEAGPASDADAQAPG